MNKPKSNNLIGISLVLLVLLIYLNSQLLVDKVKKSRETVNTLNTEVTMAKDKLAQLSNVQSELPTLKDTIDKANLVITPGRDYASIISSLEAIAAKEGITIGAINPKTVTSPTGVDNTVNFTVSASGDFAHLKAFTSDIDNNLRLMKVNAVSMSSTDGNNITASYEVSAYARDTNME